MRFTDDGAFYSVKVSDLEMWRFAERWPCSGMRGTTGGMRFQFDKRNGDLVDIKGERKEYDEGAVRALSEDAQAYAAQFLVCANCGGPLPENHGTHDKKTGLRFCDYCAGIAEALSIGNPRTSAAFLYDDGRGCATSWTGGIMGQIVHKNPPDHRRHLGAVRYRVRMLDGSMWHGSGPTANGTYIRLHRMK